MIDRGEPDELDLAVQRARRRMDAAYRDLLAAIEAEYEAKRGPSRIARYAGYSREHVSKLHSGEEMPVASRRRRKGVLVPQALGELIADLGGPDAVEAFLRRHALDA